MEKTYASPIVREDTNIYKVISIIVDPVSEKIAVALSCGRYVDSVFQEHHQEGHAIENIDGGDQNYDDVMGTVGVNGVDAWTSLGDAIWAKLKSQGSIDY